MAKAYEFKKGLDPSMRPLTPKELEQLEKCRGKLKELLPHDYYGLNLRKKLDSETLMVVEEYPRGQTTPSNAEQITIPWGKYLLVYDAWDK